MVVLQHEFNIDFFTVKMFEQKVSLFDSFKLKDVFHSSKSKNIFVDHKTEVNSFGAGAKEQNHFH